MSIIPKLEDSDDEAGLRPNIMKAKLQASLETALALLGAALLVLIWAVKKLAFAAFVLALLLPLVPSQTVERLLSLPFLAHLSPILRWLTEHGLRICVIITFLMILRLLRKIDRLSADQRNQSTVLGGLVNYLEISDFRLAPTIEDARRPGLGFAGGFELWLRTWSTAAFFRLIGRDEASAERSAGCDPFDTALKRGDKVVTLKDDIKHYLRDSIPDETAAKLRT